MTPSQRQALLALRLRLQWSVPQIADAIGVSPRTAARVLSGAVPIGPFRAAALTDAVDKVDASVGALLRVELGMKPDTTLTASDLAAQLFLVAETARVPARRFAQGVAQLLATAVERGWALGELATSIAAMAPPDAVPRQTPRAADSKKKKSK